MLGHSGCHLPVSGAVCMKHRWFSRGRGFCCSPQALFEKGDGGCVHPSQRKWTFNLYLSKMVHEHLGVVTLYPDLCCVFFLFFP